MTEPDNAADVAPDVAKVRLLFNEAIDLTGAVREAFLAKACGKNTVLRARVDGLLAAAEKPDEFLASPTSGHARGDGGVGATLAAMPREHEGQMIGRYKLLQPIGEGGFGSVWMAEQREPVKRRVALKIIKLGMDTKQVIARFEAERQALAMMDHPNIAKVLDAGATETGRPYFVMEYIKGVPILEYCDTDKLDTKARLALFTSVCHAIQHAHQKGIIHRDIKPSNVLITMHDGVPVPKVIDFGIAKATSSELTNKTLFTEHRQMIGTPAYMSPEQAEMSGLDIDTRSDIYALGVLLYELLTGTTPFATDELMSKGYAEMMRIIREVEPHKPSTRLSSLGDTGTRTAQQRHVGDAKKLGLILRGDLDWIVMKCLEKDRTRRYETANGLAADIQRHLGDEPVTAGPPSAAYKLRKFVKRNRAQVVAGSVVAVTLVLGVIGTTGGMIWALKEKNRADIERTKATLAAESEAKAKVAAQENEQRAVAQATRAETITAFVTTALNAGDAQNEGGGQDMTILAAMDNAIRDINSGRFKDDPEIEADLQSTIAEILLNNGRASEAEPLAAGALETIRHLQGGDQPNTATCLDGLARVREALGRAEDAESLFVAALEMRQRLFQGDNPSVALSLNNVAFARMHLGRFAEAEPLIVQALEMNRRLYKGDHRDVAAGLNNLGGVRQAMGRYADAEPLYVQALEMWQRLYKGDRPEVAGALSSVASVRAQLGRDSEAEPLCVQALEMNQRLFKGDNPDVARSLNGLATVRLALGRFDEAEPLFVKALEMRQRLFKGDHPDVATSLDNLACTRRDLGRLDEAEPLFVQALEMRQRLFKSDHPSVTSSKASLAAMYWSRRQLDKSIPLFEEILATEEAQFGRQHPDTLAIVANLGVNYKDADRLAEALPLLEEAHRASKQFPALNFVNAQLLEAYIKAADPSKPGDVARVVALMQELLAATRNAQPKDSPELAGQLAEYSVTLLGLKAWSVAEPLIRESLTIREKVQPDDWTTFNSKSMLGGALLGQNKVAEAEPLITEGYRGMQERENSIPPQGKPRIREALERLVQLDETKGDLAGAAAWRNLAASQPASQP